MPRIDFYHRKNSSSIHNNMKLKFSPKKTWELLKTAGKAWYAKDPFKESAVIAYYAIFSLPGLLLIVVTVAGFVFGREAVSGHLFTQIDQTMGAETAAQIQEIIAESAMNKNSVFATIIGVLTLLLGATGVL